MRSRAALLLGAWFSSAALAAEFPVAAPHVGPPSGGQLKAAAASNGRDYLVAWSDLRGFYGPGDFATHVDADGVPTNDSNIFVGVTMAMNAPAVIPVGDSYVVFESVLANTGNGGVRVSRIGPGGPDQSIVLPYQDLGIPILEAGNRIVAAFNGTRYLVVASGGKTRAELVDDSLHLAKKDFPIQSGGSGEGAVEAIAADGDTFLVAYRMADNLLRLSRVTDDGAVTQLAAPLGTATRGTTIVWDGLRYFIAWSDGAIHGRFLDRDGSFAGDEMLLAASGISPSVAWNGSEFLLAFADGENIAAARLDAAGRVAGRFPITSGATGQREPAVASAGGRFLVAWDDHVSVRSAPVDGETPSASTLLARGLAHQGDPEVAVGDGEAAFVWLETIPAYRIMFSRATFDGTPLDGAGIDLGPGVAPNVLFDGDVFLVTWRNGSTILGRRFRRQGATLDEPALVLGVSARGVGPVAVGGGEFLILWYDDSGGVRTTILRGAQIITSPATIGGVIPPGTVGAFEPFSMAWNGTHFVTIWSELVRKFDASVPNGLHAVFIDREGKFVRDTRVTPPYPLAPSSGRLADGNGSVFLAYLRDRIYGSRIDADGHASEPVDLGICAVSCPWYVTGVAWAGSRYVISAVPYTAFPKAIDARHGVVVIAYTKVLPEGAIRRNFFEVSTADRKRPARP
jgi:hypothetical protein